MREPVVYLAGPVANVPDGGASWRESVEAEYGDEIETRNPLENWNVPLDDLAISESPHADREGVVGYADIVESDLELLEESDAVLVGYEDIQSVGTPMEVRWAYERDYDIAIWVRDDTAVHDLSPWYLHHASAVTTSLELAVGHLTRSLEVEYDV
jgi:hypothetical protein